MIISDFDLCREAQLCKYDFTVENSGGDCWVRIRREGKSPFCSQWFSSSSEDRPLLVILPGYDAVFPSYPMDEVTEDFNVLLISPLGYTERNAAVDPLKIKGEFPVLFNTVFDKPNAYDQWILDVLTAIRWAREHTTANCENLLFFGTSQGGGMSLVLSGILSDKCKAVCADEPWLIGFSSDMLEAVISNASYYFPNEILSYSGASERLVLTDPITYAGKLTVPKLIMAGNKDTDYPANRIKRFFDTLPEPKDYFLFEERTHGHDIRAFRKAINFFCKSI